MTTKTIKSVAGPHWRNVLLEDDEQEFGGISHVGETLGEFGESAGVDLHDNYPWALLCYHLYCNGVRLRHK